MPILLVVMGKWRDMDRAIVVVKNASALPRGKGACPGIDGCAMQLQMQQTGSNDGQ
jgi:hypothetical protein